MNELRIPKTKVSKWSKYLKEDGDVSLTIWFNSREAAVGEFFRLNNTQARVNGELRPIGCIPEITKEELQFKESLYVKISWNLFESTGEGTV